MGDFAWSVNSMDFDQDDRFVGRLGEFDRVDRWGRLGLDGSEVDPLDFFDPTLEREGRAGVVPRLPVPERPHAGLVRVGFSDGAVRWIREVRLEGLWLGDRLTFPLRS